MGEITAKLVKDLREKTGAGMMDCKKALTENQGDFESSVDWLRKKGLAAAAKKSSRVTAEGLVAVAHGKNKAVIIELNTETDFVARNDKFQYLINQIAEIALDYDSIEQLKSAPYQNSGRTVEEEVAECVSVIGENMNLRRLKKIEIDQGIIVSYVHNSITKNLGKIAVLVALKGNEPHEAMDKLGKQIAMHIAATKPESLNIDNVDQNLLERERKIFFEQAKASGKPESIIEKMLDGRIKKYYEEIVLLEQVFVIDGKTKIKDVLTNASQNDKMEIKDFAIFVLGDGIEQEETNFADEVKAVMKQ